MAGLFFVAAPVSADSYVKITVADPSGSSLEVRTVLVRPDDVDRTVERLNAQGVSAGRTSTVQALGDPLLDQQWGYQRLGGETVGAATPRSGEAIVAVVDSGVDYRHPDLAGRVLSGYDMIADRPMAQAYDDNGHGTHVAGVISALTNNDAGIAGLTRSKILPVKVLDETGYGDDAGVARGIVWAVDHNADVINLSLGTYDDNPAMEAAVAYAVDRGVAVVAAAGNDGAGGKAMYPAAYPAATAVAATTTADRRAIFSTTGSYVDLAAPGQGILSTFPGGQYVVMSGTSMAAPHVSASVALVMQNKDVSARQAVNTLERTAIDLGDPGADSEFGVGLLNLPVATGTGDPVPWETNGPGLTPGMPAVPTLPPLDPLDPPTLPEPDLPVPAPPAPQLPGTDDPTIPTLPRPTPPATPAPSVAPGLLVTVLPLSGQQSVKLTVRVPATSTGERVRVRGENGSSVYRRTSAANSMGIATFTIPQAYAAVTVRVGTTQRTVDLKR